MDYQALINEAVKNNDLAKAGEYEQSRNAKITDLGLGYETTNKYQSYIPATQNTYQAKGTFNDDILSDSDKNLIAKYKDLYDNAKTDDEKIKAHDMAEAVRAKYGYSGGGDGSDYLGFGNKIQASSGFNSSYSTQIDSVLQSILNRKPFEYDYKTDDSYLAYEKLYRNLGNRAREDVIGDVAGLTGGYGSSWAVSAGSQAQNQYNQQLASTIPELERLAYGKYNDEYNRDVSNLGLLRDIDNTEYGRWRDTVSDSRYADETAYNRGRDSIGDSRYEDETLYNRYRDLIGDSRYYDETQYNRYRDYVGDVRYNNEWNYQKGRDSVADSRYNDELAYDREQDAIKNSAKNDDSGYSNLLRRVKSEMDRTQKPETGAYLLLENVGSEQDYYSLGQELGISNVILDKIYREVELKALNSESQEDRFEKIYQTMINDADPFGWLEANRTSLTSNEYLELLKILEKVGS